MQGAGIPHPSVASPSNPVSSHDMKDKLISSGEHLMRADRERAAASVSRTWCDALGELQGLQTEQHCNEFSCHFAPANSPDGGLGLGRAGARMPPEPGHPHPGSHPSA
jgi:hypothetical protein